MPNYRSLAAWQFNIDKYINRFVPPSVVKHLPAPISHFLGHRTTPSPKYGTLIVVAWAFVGVFCGVSVVNVVIAHIRAFRADAGTASITVGSFGAAAVLQFYAIEAPLAQPRNAVGGQVLSSLVGVAVARLFSLAGPARFHTLRWLAGSIACAAATAVMALTGTVHPPAGATALIAVTDAHIYDIGWYLIPAVLLGSVLMQCVALIINNIQRQYPTYWWSPGEVGQFYKQFISPAKAAPVDEKTGKLESAQSSYDENRISPAPAAGIAPSSSANGDQMDDRHANNADPESGLPAPDEQQIVIGRDTFVIPNWISLRPEERSLLEALRERL